MALLISLITFIAVTLGAYGVLYRSTGVSAMDARLGGLRYQRVNREDLPDPEAAFGTRVVKPLIRSLNQRMTTILPSTMYERLDRALTQAGVKLKAGQFMVILAVLVGALPLLALFYATSLGLGAQQTLMAIGGGLAFAIMGPRVWLLGRIRRRQKEIWRSLPDAFDLVTASVEAGLGIDAAFTRVIDKVRGPFAEELTRTMNEIQMGRSRRDAFLDLSDRTGVEELRSLVNSIVQAESMGISIGGVIRVQTGVIRTKRRQKAEEQAFKAPIKMVFPLVFFIFPSIFVVIGGPAILQMKDTF